MDIVFLGLAFAGFIIYSANLAEINQTRSRSWVTMMLFMIGFIGIGLGLYVVYLSVSYPELVSALEDSTDAAQIPQISYRAAAIFLGLSVVLGGISAVTALSLRFRLWLERFVIRSNGGSRRYSAHSVVHTTAVVLALFQTLNTIGGFVMSGGIEGLAQEFEAGALSMDALVGNFLFYVLLSLLGVGLFIRRDTTQARRRLGLIIPSQRDVLIGAAVGFALFWAQVFIIGLWELVVSPETLAEQTAASEQIFTAFSGSLAAGLLLALLSGIGEEVLFRGALQPIFGIGWTTIFFTVMHTQYTLTPAALVIFGVSAAFGILRQRSSTSASIVAHVIYNFLPFLLFWISGQMPTQAAAIPGF